MARHSQHSAWLALILRALIACEFSGIVRESFASAGFDAWSCDLLPSLLPGQHIIDDVRNIIGRGHWDIMIAHPPCTHLCSSGAKWFKEKAELQEEALAFVEELLVAPVRHIALENPVGIISTRIRKPEQIIQPWQFGHRATKTTCLWLKNLPALTPTSIKNNPISEILRARQGPNRGLERSITPVGIAQAMAKQWGKFVMDSGNSLLADEVEF
jgi:hypothetical protein